MLEFLDYPFFRYALVAVILIAVCAAMIGTYIITRRLVAITGGVTHACFGGLGLGYYLGIDPAIMAGVFAVGSSLGVEWLSSRFRLREDSVIAVIWALGMAIGVIFVFITPGYVPELNSFLFGNILTITRSDVIVFAVFTAVLTVFFLGNLQRIIICAFDRDFATVMRLPVRFITYTMTVLTAICIVLTIRLVGVMLLMSMLSLPMMTAELFFKNFRPMVLVSIGVSLLCSITGLFVGAVVDVPCSAIIVVAMAGVFIIAKTAQMLTKYYPTNKNS